MIIKTTEQRILELEERVAKLETRNTHSYTEVTDVQKKKFSAKEFLMTKEAKTEMQKTLVFGYYLEYFGGMSSFNINDLATVFQAAKEKRPKNINDAINKNIARGLLMEDEGRKDSKKVWVLTSTGEKYVKEELEKIN